SGQVRQALGFSFGVVVGDDKILSLQVAQLAQATANCFHVGIGLRSAVEQHPQPSHLRWLLRARRKRPRGRRTAEKRDELPPCHLTQYHLLPRRGERYR